MTFNQFAEKHGLTMTAQARSRRDDSAGDNWDARARHFRVEIKRGSAVIWSGFYSVGAAWPEMWARDGCKIPGSGKSDSQARLALARMDRKPGGFPRRAMSIHDAGLWETVLARFDAIAPLKIADILESLQLDVMDADSPFEEWAENFGLDTDSRKAESMWRAVRDTASQLRHGLGLEAFAEFLEIEPQ